jgi:hypothetical protein
MEEIKIDENTQRMLLDLDKIVQELMIRKDLIIRTIFNLNGIENRRDYMMSKDYVSLKKIILSNKEE